MNAKDQTANNENQQKRYPIMNGWTLVDGRWWENNHQVVKNLHERKIIRDNADGFY